MTAPEVDDAGKIVEVAPRPGRRGGPGRQRLAFVLMFATFAVVLVVMVLYTMSSQHGVFTYALDDAAIHLTLARNLIHHGTFGMVPGTYQSASSAPIWEVLLGPLLLVTGDAEWTPLLMNVVAAAWVLWTFSGLPLIQRLVADGLGRVAVMALPIGLGLVPLAMSGMEHTLHVAVTVQVLALLVSRLRADAPDRAFLPVAGLLAFGTLVRFETGFLAVGCAAALMVSPVGVPARRHARAAALLVASAVLPVAAFATVNRAFGQYSLPNSVVAKTPLGHGGLPIPSLSATLDKLVADPVLVAGLVAGALVLAVRRRGPGRDVITTVPLIAVLLTAVAHVMFAEIGWFERYQAYLIAGLAFGVLTAIGPVSTRDARRRTALVLMAACLLRLPLLINTPIATDNVYATAQQTARFLRDNYRGEAVAVNDIGYVGWQHEGDLVDVFGLASYDMLKARTEGTMSSAQTGALFAAHGVRVMVVYDEFFAGIVPEGWDGAGRWCLTTRRLVVSSECVTFYAPRGQEWQRLRDALVAFSPQLPDSVAATTS